MEYIQKGVQKPTKRTQLRRGNNGPVEGFRLLQAKGGIGKGPKGCHHETSEGFNSSVQKVSQNAPVTLLGCYYGCCCDMLHIIIAVVAGSNQNSGRAAVERMVVPVRAFSVPKVNSTAVMVFALGIGQIRMKLQ